MENESEVLTQETEQIEEVAEEQVVEAEAERENLDDLQKRLATTTAQKNHYKEQLEKRAALETATRASLSPSDLVAVMNAQIHEDDMERVERFALSEGVSIREAVKSPELKAMLQVRAEQRNVAIATNVENVRRGVSKVSDDALVSNASMGKIPDSDDEIARLISAKMKR
jgi:hypothetical protein